MFLKTFFVLFILLIYTIKKSLIFDTEKQFKGNKNPDNNQLPRNVYKLQTLNKPQGKQAPTIENTIPRFKVYFSNMFEIITENIKKYLGKIYSAFNKW